MSEPYLGEIRLVGFNFAPSGWALCQGQLLPISENTALFTLIGTTYGGDGETTFALPDLRGRLPLHQGTGRGLSSRPLGLTGGVETVTLTSNQLPAHTHVVRAASVPGTRRGVSSGVPAPSSDRDAAYGSTARQSMSGASTTPVGAGRPHSNLGPALTVNAIISLFGPFPSPS